MMEQMPECPSGGTYTWAEEVPPVDYLFVECSLADRLNHRITDTQGW